jgi:hypothetical protein
LVEHYFAHECNGKLVPLTEQTLAAEATVALPCCDGSTAVVLISTANGLSTRTAHNVTVPCSQSLSSDTLTV